LTVPIPQTRDLLSPEPCGTIIAFFHLEGVTMSTNKKPHSSQQNQDDEIGDSALEAVSGGQGAMPVQKMEPVVITASRLPPSGVAVQKMDPIIVTAKRLPPDAGNIQVASAGGKNKKPS
jgi:hypothetical protein